MELCEAMNTEEVNDSDNKPKLEDNFGGFDIDDGLLIVLENKKKSVEVELNKVNDEPMEVDKVSESPLLVNNNNVNQKNKPKLNYQLKITKQELNGFRDICIFLSKIYIMAWINATDAIKAPFFDLCFLKSLFLYKDIDENISLLTVAKFCNHLWYLSPENAALAFFDTNVPINNKIKMVRALKTNNKFEGTKKYFLQSQDIKIIINMNIEDFITTESNNFFKRFNISMDFLKIDPILWEHNDDYITGLNTVNKLKVTNDVTERGVKLIEDYNNILTKDEKQKQYLLQVVSEHRKMYPNTKKSTLSQNF